jgi:hypothetical protein
MPSALRRKFFQSSEASSSASNSETGVAETNLQDPERYAAHTDSKHTVDNDVTDQSASEDFPNEEAQAGVTQAEAITLTWTKSSMIATYVLYVLSTCDSASNVY